MCWEEQEELSKEEDKQDKEKEKKKERVEKNKKEGKEVGEDQEKKKELGYPAQDMDHINMAYTCSEILCRVAEMTNICIFPKHSIEVKYIYIYT